MGQLEGSVIIVLGLAYFHNRSPSSFKTDVLGPLRIEVRDEGEFF